MRCKFKIGQKVICIAHFWKAVNHNEKLPEKNKTYTVRDITWNETGNGIRLEEIINIPKDYDRGFMECAFSEEMFKAKHETFKPVENIFLKTGSLSDIELCLN